MNAAAKPGLGDMGSTRPLSRADRRAAASRVTTETSPAVEQEPAASNPPVDPLPSTVRIPMKRSKPKKRPIATQIRPETLARVEWVQEQGAALTDLVDAALTAYLDAAGVPQPDTDGKMPS